MESRRQINTGEDIFKYKPPNPSNLPLLARRSARNRRGAGHERQLEDSGTLEAPVANQTVVGASHVHRVVNISAVLHDLAHELVGVVLTEHNAAVQDEAIVHNIPRISLHDTSHRRCDDLRYKLTRAHVGVVRDVLCRAREAVHGDGH